MSRTFGQMALVVYLLTVPAGAYVFLAKPSSAYPSKMGGLVVVALMLVGLALILVVERKTTGAADSTSKSPSKKVSGSE